MYNFQSNPFPTLLKISFRSYNLKHRAKNKKEFTRKCANFLKQANVTLNKINTAFRKVILNESLSPKEKTLIFGKEKRKVEEISPGKIDENEKNFQLLKEVQRQSYNKDEMIERLKSLLGENKVKVEKLKDEVSFLKDVFENVSHFDFIFLIFPKIQQCKDQIFFRKFETMHTHYQLFDLELLKLKHRIKTNRKTKYLTDEVQFEEASPQKKKKKLPQVIKRLLPTQRDVKYGIQFLENRFEFEKLNVGFRNEGD